MMRRVVDTNVPIVANGRETDASLDCRLAAVEFLNVLCARGKTILDLAGEIQEEYHRYLHPRGQPGVGDQFYRMVLNSAPSRRSHDVWRKSATRSGSICQYSGSASMNTGQPPR